MEKLTLKEMLPEKIKITKALDTNSGLHVANSSSLLSLKKVVSGSMDGYPSRTVGVVSGGIVGKRAPQSTATNRRKQYRGAHLLLSPIPSSCPSFEQRDLHFCLEKFYALFIANVCRSSWMSQSHLFTICQRQAYGTASLGKKEVSYKKLAG
jgi:hypothetical protein